MSGTLYVVATPIGNLADITLRALSTLKEVDLIAAEDTRVTHHLLDHYGIHTPTTPYHQHSLARKAEHLIEQMKEGKNIAIVSDAGTPGISDPGHEIIALAVAEGIPVVSIPGPSAIITSLVVSGLPTRRFVFEGFPPRRSGERRSLWSSLKDEQRTMVFYESPNRVLKTLDEMQEAWGAERRIAVMREATKMFEEVHRGTILSAIERFTAVAPRGEFTIVVEGSTSQPETSGDEIDQALRELLDTGMSERDAVRQVCTMFPVPKKEIYHRMLEMKGESDDEE